jgi:2'-5' RNA ligase
MLETALVLVPEAARPALEPVRAVFDQENVSRGIPLHITLLYPFVAPEEVVQELRDELGEMFRAHRPLRFSLTEVRVWPGVTWAAPEPASEIAELSRAIWRRFPDRPPYGGEVGEPTPHATLAEKGGVTDAVRAAVAPLLPIDCLVDKVTLLAEGPPERWAVTETFDLG